MKRVYRKGTSRFGVKGKYERGERLLLVPRNRKNQKIECSWCNLAKEVLGIEIFDAVFKFVC